MNQIFMQYNKYLLFIITFLFSCNYKSKEVTITQVNNIQDCHMCPGYLLINRGNTLDTLKMGTWGIPPKFKQFTANEKNYLALESSYFSNGINEYLISILSLNENDFLINVFDTLISDKEISSFDIIRRKVELKIPKMLVIHNQIETFNHKNERSHKTDAKKEIVLLNLVQSK